MTTKIVTNDHRQEDLYKKKNENEREKEDDDGASCNERSPEETRREIRARNNRS